MLIYIFRGISVMLAVLYTTATLCISSVPKPEPDAAAAILHAESDSPQQKEITVQILQNRENIGLALQQALDLYTDKSVSTIRFSVQTVAAESDYHAALRASLLSNNGADLFQISGAREFFELEENIRVLEPADWILSAYEGSLDAVSHNDNIYGIPYSIEAIGLICRRDAFDAADILPENIRNLADLDEAFAKIKESIASGDFEALIGMEHVTEFAGGDKSFLAKNLADVTLSGEFSEIGDAVISRSVDFPAAEQAEEFIEIMAKYSSCRTNWPKLATITESGQIESFANGRAAVILQDTNAYKRISEINPDMRERMQLLPIPFDIFEQPSIYVGTPLYWVVNASASDKAADAATGFLEWLYTSEEGSEIFAKEFRDVSAFRKKAKSTGISLHSQMLSYMSADMTMPQFNREYPAGWGKNVFAPNIQSYFTQRERTWSEVIEACKAGWTDLPN